MNLPITFTGVIAYNNAGTDKSSILSDNAGKTGIYLWKHQESGTIYIGSAVDLSIRLSSYYLPSQLKRIDNYICRAIIRHGHSAFSLTILEYINISNLSKETTRKLILDREQYYLDLIFSTGTNPNTYNILKTAGSSLGLIQSPETRLKISEALKGKMSGENSPLFGKEVSPDTRAKISVAHKGKYVSPETRAKMSLAKIGENNPQFGKEVSPDTRAKISVAHKGNSPSAVTRNKMSAAQGTAIFIYSKDSKLENTFSSAREAAKFLNSSKDTILRYAKNGKLFQEKWILSLSAK